MEDINIKKTKFDEIYHQMNRYFIFLMLAVFIYACHDKKDHPDACFSVENPIMNFGDTVKIKLCGTITRESAWDMGGTIYHNAEIPKHVYKAKGTYIIKLNSSEHIDGGKIFIHWQKRATSEAQQTVTVQ